MPEDNKDTAEPAKVINISSGMRNISRRYGKKGTPDDLITMSEKVYNFQRVFNLRMGFGRREHDHIPYRAMGPVTIDEYESRQDRYDEQLVKEYGVNITEKLRRKKWPCCQVRQEEYEKLKDAVYKRRGWTQMASPPLRP